MSLASRKASIDGKSRPAPLLAQRASDDLQQLDEAFHRVRNAIPNIQKGLEATQIYLQLIEKRGEQLTHSSIQGIRSQEFSHAKNVYTHFHSVVSALESCIELMDAINDHKLRIATLKSTAVFDSVAFAKATRSASVSYPNTHSLENLNTAKRPQTPTSQRHSPRAVPDSSTNATRTSIQTGATMPPHPSTRTQRIFPWLTSRRYSSHNPHTSHSTPQTAL